MILLGFCPYCVTLFILPAYIYTNGVKVYLNYCRFCRQKLSAVDANYYYIDPNQPAMLYYQAIIAYVRPNNRLITLASLN